MSTEILLNVAEHETRGAILTGVEAGGAHRDPGVADHPAGAQHGAVAAEDADVVAAVHGGFRNNLGAFDADLILGGDHGVVQVA